MYEDVLVQRLGEQPNKIIILYGALWENFLLAERQKTLAYTRRNANRYFWRTYTGAELDYVEETGGQLYGYEFKFSKKNSPSPTNVDQRISGQSF